MAPLDEFARSQYVSLITYRRDGTPVATPVWLAVDGGELYTVSSSDAGKVKRIRNNGRATVTVCDFRGRIAPDAPTADGTARLLDAAETLDARRLLSRKYFFARLAGWATRIPLVRRPPGTGIAVTF
jgi:PPOX class probable F420-dependent enzyme